MAKLGYFINRGTKTIVLLFSVFLFQGCKNDIDINGNWKETMIVYGLLNPNDTIQYIKINKAFINENADVKQVAKISDSLFFDTLVVKITDNNGKSILFQRKDDVTKVPGYFATDRNTLYFTKEKIDSSKVYQLEVYNPKSGKKATASTSVLYPAKFIAPVTSFTTVTTIIPDKNIVVNFIPGKNAKAYDFKLSLAYDEFSTDDTMSKTRKIITWNALTNFYTEDLDGQIRMTQFISGLAFYQFVSANIQPADAKIKRRPIYLNYDWYGGGTQLLDYISVNEPSIGIVQKQAEFTNIEGGYGIFSSRYTQSFKNIGIDVITKSNLINNTNTNKLGFIF